MNRILLIESDRGTARGLRGSLESEGFQVVEERDGASGLRTASEGAFDLILLDLKLPERSGFDVLEELRCGGDVTPIILLSARNAEDDRIRGLGLGANDYLTRPFSLGELLARIQARTRDAQRLAVLHDAIAATSDNRDLDPTLAALVEHALALSGAERGMVLLADPTDRPDATDRPDRIDRPDRDDATEAGDRFRVEIAMERGGRRLPGDVRHSTTIVRRVFRTGKAEALLDTEDGRPWRGGSVHDLRLRNILCAPLIAGERRIGVLYVDSQFRVQGFSRGDLGLFRTLAAQCGAAVERARLERAQTEMRRLEQSLHEARDIQRAMLPAGPLTGCSVEVAGLSRPAEETGGDYYDYLPLDEDRLALIMGDVVGHGLPAALVMAGARSLLRAFVPRNSGPGEALEDVNRALARDLPAGEFMSLFLGELNTRTGELRYASAGHEHALLFRAAEAEFEELEPTGPALGVLGECVFPVRRVHALRPHDLLLLYTDGVTEAKAADGGERFGRRRLESSIRALRGSSAADVVEHIAADVLRFHGSSGLDDDCSLLAVKASDLCRVGTSSLRP